ncbi:MAG TPA: hypothetical protein VFJ58_12115 [Armatimonadota bacterium]|nr:hypothetical protein [Armatimonadota bacterium]
MTEAVAESLALYRELGRRVRAEAATPDLSQLLLDIARLCLEYLSGAARVPLISQVIGKEYFAFEIAPRRSRPLNAALFEETTETLQRFLDSLSSDSLSDFGAEQITRACYTLVMSFCCMVDLQGPGDQKTPGTFFELVVCHLFARRFGVLPRKRLEVLNLDMTAALPTDLIFDLGKDQPKFHVPVKISTRERVVQVWAHQRVLDGIYGTGRFLGLLVCVTETNSIKGNKVAETCLPDQWRIYQMFIAQLKRVYYLDVPLKYAQLAAVFPRIHVKPFGAFFLEADNLGLDF